jgi:Cdc6-like AAA superfamily ATPase
MSNEFIPPSNLPGGATEEMLKRLQRHVAIAEAFRPSAPIDSVALFAGRTQQVGMIMNAIFQKGQHAIIYGERGVGKTSLANTLYDFLKGMGLPQMTIGTINCDSTVNFSNLWKRVFRETFVEVKTTQTGFQGVALPETRIPFISKVTDNVTPEDVRYLFQTIGKPTIVILDELDRIQDESTRALIADTIKTLSDHAVDVTLILVGVASAVNELLASHKSIERALVQVSLPRMSMPELIEIIDKGLARVSMTIAENVKYLIVGMSQGLPHYTHLLTLGAAQHANNVDRTHITPEDIKSAIASSVANAQQTLITDYHKAVSSPRENMFTEVLLACALAKTDGLGYFSASDVKPPLAAIKNRTYDVSAFSRHLNDFCEPERGAVLEKFGQPRRYRFRFANPLMEPFVIMKGFSDKMVNENVLESCFKEIAQFH